MEWTETLMEDMAPRVDGDNTHHQASPSNLLITLRGYKLNQKHIFFNRIHEHIIIIALTKYISNLYYSISLTHENLIFVVWQATNRNSDENQSWSLEIGELLLKKSRKLGISSKSSKQSIVLNGNDKIAIAVYWIESSIHNVSFGKTIIMNIAHVFVTNMN